jgi:hypothetical protein
VIKLSKGSGPTGPADLTASPSEQPQVLLLPHVAAELDGLCAVHELTREEMVAVCFQGYLALRVEAAVTGDCDIIILFRKTGLRRILRLPRLRKRVVLSTPAAVA